MKRTSGVNRQLKFVHFEGKTTPVKNNDAAQLLEPRGL